MLLKILYWFLLQSAKIRCYGVQNITRIFHTFNMHLFFHIFHLFFRQLTACQLTKLPHRNAGFVRPDIHIDLSDRKTKWAFEYLSKRFLRRPTELWPGDQAVCKHNQSKWTQSFSPESKLFTLKKKSFGVLKCDCMEHPDWITTVYIAVESIHISHSSLIMTSVFPLCFPIL